MDVVIEKPEPEDLEEIDRIAVQVHECHVKWRPDIFEHTDHILHEEQLAHMIRHDGIIVAKHGDRIAGYAMLSSREGKKNGYRYRKQLEIEAMGVDEPYRNRGIGRELLAYIRKYARENGYTDIRLTVNEENESARHLYEKAGFRVRNISYTLRIGDTE